MASCVPVGHRRSSAAREVEWRARLPYRVLAILGLSSTSGYLGRGEFIHLVPHEVESGGVPDLASRRASNNTNDARTLVWRFAHLGSSFDPLCKGLKDFSRMRIQSGVAENLFLPGGLPQISKNIFERNRGFAFVPGPLYGRLPCEEMP